MRSVARELNNSKSVHVVIFYNKYAKTMAYTNVYQEVFFKVYNGALLIRDVIWKATFK